MIVGKDYQVKNQYGNKRSFVIARNRNCEGIYYIGHIETTIQTPHYYHNYGDVPLSELYTNHSDHRMTDEELIRIVNNIKIRTLKSESLKLVELYEKSDNEVEREKLNTKFKEICIQLQKIDPKAPRSEPPYISEMITSTIIIF